MCFVMRACVGVHFLFSFSGILCVCHSYIIELCRFGDWCGPASSVVCGNQCATFTGMIPVFGVLLILFEWYW